MDNKELQVTAKKIRKDIVEMIYNANSSHVGCALSSVDIWTALYFGGAMDIDPKNPLAITNSSIVYDMIGDTLSAKKMIEKLTIIKENQGQKEITRM